MADKDVKELRSAIDEISTVAARAFSEISTIAHLALSGMENPVTCGDVETFAQAFEAIARAAGHTQNTVEMVAEDAGCPCVDSAQRRRTAARLAATQGRA